MLNGNFWGLHISVENVHEILLSKRGYSSNSNLYKATYDGASLSFDSLTKSWEKN